MKKINIFLLTAALSISVAACKDKSSDTLPREAYNQNTEGTDMKTAPDANSTTAAVIPFAEKITLTENSEKIKPQSSGDKTKWYRTEWNGKSGWIAESSVGAKESVTEQIKISFTEQKANFTEDFIKAFESSPVQIIDRYSFPGGDMEPAKMFFLSGGIMVINSKIFSEHYSNKFFSYEFVNDSKLLKIKFVDSKLNFTEYADIENSSQSVFKIDKNEHAIIYQIKNNSFLFFNWGFVKE